MKKLLILALFAASLFASKAAVEGMAELELGVNKIQKGFLYNQKALIIEGADDVAKANMMFENIGVTQKYLPENKKHMTGIAINIAKRISLHADELKGYTNNAQYTKAADSYSAIIQSCTACHAIVRGW